MKRILYIIASLFTLLCVISCEINSGHTDITNQRTLAGKYIFEVVEGNLNSYIKSLDMALKFDAYLQADEKGKERILKYLLPRYQFSEKGDTIFFISDKNEWGYDRENKWTILRASTDSLSSPTSAWSLGFSLSSEGIISNNIPLGGFRLTGSEERNTWILDIKEHDKGDYNLSEGLFSVKKLTDRKLYDTRQINDYSIAMGSSIHASIKNKPNDFFGSESICVKYQLSKPFYMKLIQSEKNSLFVEGAAEMDVQQGESPTKKDHVSAAIDQNDYEFVTIQYKGITESHLRNKYIYGNGYGNY